MVPNASAYFKNKVVPLFESLNWDRRSILLKGWALKLILIFCGIGYFYLDFLSESAKQKANLMDFILCILFLIPVIILALTVRAYRFLPGKTLNKYRRRMKEEIIYPFILLWNKNIEYRPLFKTSPKQLIKSGLFKGDCTDSFEEDGIFGRLSNIYFRFSEIKMLRRLHTQFAGIFITIQFQEESHQKTLLVEKHKEPGNGKYLRTGQTANFDVYSEQSESLCDEFTHKLIGICDRFKSDTKRDVRFSFVENELFAAITVNRNLFELTLKPLKKQSKRIFQDIVLLEELFSFLDDIDAAFQTT